ncbi:MAG: divergent polysaccharide deacetylase family protein, partial [Deltaproteobacteria bacterium]|nr:divergent polysaccharide deacetylase family protein [Deltaproteobacteria bacterium]
PGALYVGYAADRIADTIRKNISDVPFAIGVNNHMGSRFTSRRKEMKHTLNVIKEKDLFFVDSLTTSRSTAYQTARRLHMATACRNMFLDTVPDENAVFSRLLRLKRHARKFGNAIGIGHPHAATARAIGRFINDHRHAGLSFVYVSRLINPV